MQWRDRPEQDRWQVSMESGLEDRNNIRLDLQLGQQIHVSMESGLEDRNNSVISGYIGPNGSGSQWSPA